MTLLERERELAWLADRAEEALVGAGSVTLVCGEPGAGKTAIIDEFLASMTDRARPLRILAAACDPLETPRPLGPVHDIASGLGTAASEAIRESEHPYEMFSAIFDDLASAPSVLVVDDLHWADQGTVDLLRFLLRRIAQVPVLVIGALRDDELGLSHPGRSLLGDIARSPVAHTLRVPPLSVDAVSTLIEDRAIDPEHLHHLTAGNPFFVVEMLDQPSEELPQTVRDAVLARTVGLRPAAWDLLHLLTAAPEAIPDRLLAPLGITLPALQELDAAGLVRRGSRGVTFRHDLCRLAVCSVIPPGASSALHLRLLRALEASATADPAVLVHHAAGAGDDAGTLRYADAAGRAAARAGAHTQAAEFLRLALDAGGAQEPRRRADLLERLAAELYLVDELGAAIDAASDALGLREEVDDVVGAGVGHNALAVYEWYNANRTAAVGHVDRTVASLDRGRDAGTEAEVTLGHAFAMQAFLALHASDLDRAEANMARARSLAASTGDPSLAARAGIVDGARAVMRGDLKGRTQILAILDAAPVHLDEVHSSGYSNLSYLDVEQRRLDDAAALLDRSIPLMAEHDLPICRVWQMGSRARVALLRGAWDDALADADEVLSKDCAPLAQTWPHIVRGLVGLRRSGDAGDDLERAWALAVRYGEPARMLPAASALAEQMWLTGVVDARLAIWIDQLASSPRTALEWARGDLAVWLQRLGLDVDAEQVAPACAAILDGEVDTALDLLRELPLPYEAAIAALDAGRPDLIRPALDALDRLGADAVAAKLRRDLRASGSEVVPARRRTTTRSNPVGLTTRQLEVLEAMADGSTNAELAGRLFVSEKTIDHHVSAILTKLAVRNRREAVRRARELGISSAVDPWSSADGT